MLADAVPPTSISSRFHKIIDHDFFGQGFECLPGRLLVERMRQVFPHRGSILEGHDKGDIVGCDECEVRLEVVGLDPIELDVAPDEDDEDGDDDDDDY